jgi:hypothetical protein
MTTGANPMAREIGIQELIQRATTVLPVSGEDLLLIRGITAEAVERIFALKRAAAHLQAKYTSCATSTDGWVASGF